MPTYNVRWIDPHNGYPDCNNGLTLEDIMDNRRNDPEVREWAPRAQVGATLHVPADGYTSIWERVK
jgi:hypothetical protein